MSKPEIVGFALVGAVMVCAAASVAQAACDIANPPSAPGSFSTRMDTQTSDKVKISGGCIDGAPIGQNTPSLGNFSSLTVNGVAASHMVMPFGWGPAFNPTGYPIITLDRASTLQSIVGTVIAPVGAAATVSINKAPSGTACASGTVMHSGSFNANGTADTNQTLVVTVTALAAGDRLCLVTTGTTNWDSGTGIGIIVARFSAP